MFRKRWDSAIPRKIWDSAIPLGKKPPQSGSSFEAVEPHP